MKVPIVIREGRDTDKEFIYNSWLKSYRKAKRVEGVPSEIYFKEHQRIISELFLVSAIRVACSREDSDQILGWICYQNSPQILHYVYVKSPFRRLGIASKLLDGALGAEFFHTHETWVTEKLLKERNAIYNPYLVR